MKNKLFIVFLLCASQLFAQKARLVSGMTIKNDSSIRVGAKQFNVYLPWLKDKRVAVVANHTSLVDKTHLVDTLLALKVKVKKIFSPEHGFRGDGDAGESIQSGKDKKTGLPVISLYGNHKKPTPKDLEGIDVVVFDVQDVGVRFFTYISTMTYVMEACAELNKTFVVLDRPNPNGYYVDGPVLEDKYKSFVGMHPVPVVHGMTVAEYARMVSGEGWLKNGVRCNIKYVTCEGYTHNDLYQLPVKPSPNLPNMAAVYLYPSVCLFEGTAISVGRGTEYPFQVIGHPNLKNTSFDFTPHSIPGASKNPPYKDSLCHGHDLRSFAENYMRSHRKLYLFWLQGCYEDFPDKEKFFNNYFFSLAGTAELKQQIIDGKTEDQVRKSWQPGLEKFREIRTRYLLYPDFK
ncbi:MAG: hypothetical protein FD123_3689 [Bacteroidetes bacterium]|nr:MAG: hypothetical protein FD123_3689 [Bacteroidota bacterium]